VSAAGPDLATPAGRTRAELLRVAAPDGDGVRWISGADQPPEGGPWETVVLDGVLEQVEDPEAWLRALVDDGSVAPGRLVVGVRNAAYAGVLAELASGRATGTGTGLLDRRQRCWFTLDTLRDVLEATGFVIGEVHRVRHPVTGSDDRACDTESYVIVARPSGDRSRLAELTAALAEAAALRARLDGVQALIGDERAEHARLIEDGRRDLVALRAENAELTRALDKRAAELAKAQAAASTIRTSPAYRTGEKVLRTTRPVRGARRRVRRGVGSVLKRLK
jgi:hypothetical protein